MITPACPVCNGPMKKNGTTSSGRTRWRCKDRSCGSSRTRAYDRRSADLCAFLDWLVSESTQERGRTRDNVRILAHFRFSRLA